jgi:hypothetical protein
VPADLSPSVPAPLPGGTEVRYRLGTVAAAGLTPRAGVTADGEEPMRIFGDLVP